MLEMSMTITRALVELKTLTKRIDKLTKEVVLLRVVQKGDGKDLQTFVKNTKAAYQSLTDLIKHRDNLKAKILQSNAQTKVKLGQKDYTIAQVIDLKQTLYLKTELLSKMRDQRKKQTEAFEAQQTAIRGKLDRLLEIEFGKDTKSNAANVETITNSYLASNRVELQDPIGIDKEIAKLEEEIQYIDTEADLVLSESNAVTKIKP